MRQRPDLAFQLLQVVSMTIADAGGFVIWIPDGTGRAAQIGAVPADGAVILGDTTDLLRVALASRRIQYTAIGSDADHREVAVRVAELYLSVREG